MDIRIASYRPNVTVSTVSQANNPLSTSFVQNANQSGPVPAVAGINQIANAPNSGGGYTDSIRGSLINILA